MTSGGDSATNRKHGNPPRTRSRNRRWHHKGPFQNLLSGRLWSFNFLFLRGLGTFFLRGSFQHLMYGSCSKTVSGSREDGGKKEETPPHRVLGGNETVRVHFPSQYPAHLGNPILVPFCPLWLKMPKPSGKHSTLQCHKRV